MYRFLFLFCLILTPITQIHAFYKDNVPTDNGNRVKYDPTKPFNWLTKKPIEHKEKKKRPYFPLLQAIKCDELNDCYAVLDDQVFTQNDVVSGYSISSITDNYVFIKRAGKQWTLSLFSQDIKN